MYFPRQRMTPILLLCMLSLVVFQVDAGTTLRHSRNRIHQGLEVKSFQSDTEEIHFSYDVCSQFAPKHWGKYWEGCAKSRHSGHPQSPINIKTEDVEYVEDYEDMKYKDEDSDVTGTISNNGHTAVFTADDTTGDSSDLKILKNVPELDDKEYAFVEWHFHIGTIIKHNKCHDFVESTTGRNPGGSEHSINGNFREGEFHFVHWKREDEESSLTKSANEEYTPDGLVAVGVFFQVGHPVNEEAERIIQDYIPRVRRTHSTPIEDVHFNPAKLLPDDNRFYTYKGTKTTPACNDNVRFVIYKTPIYISQHSYHILQRTHTNEHHHEVNISEFGNRRPIQHSHDDVEVKANFEEEETDKNGRNGNKGKENGKKDKEGKENGKKNKEGKENRKKWGKYGK